jgi:hypothetical protein
MCQAECEDAARRAVKMRIHRNAGWVLGGRDIQGDAQPDPECVRGACAGVVREGLRGSAFPHGLSPRSRSDGDARGGGRGVRGGRPWARVAEEWTTGSTASESSGAGAGAKSSESVAPCKTSAARAPAAPSPPASSARQQARARRPGPGGPSGLAGSKPASAGGRPASSGGRPASAGGPPGGASEPTRASAGSHGPARTRLPPLLTAATPRRGMVRGSSGACVPGPRGLCVKGALPPRFPACRFRVRPALSLVGAQARGQVRWPRRPAGRLEWRARP